MSAAPVEDVVAQSSHLPPANVFTHVSRAPVTGGGPNDWQRRFGGYWPVRKAVDGFNTGTYVTVFRSAKEDHSSLQIGLQTDCIGTVDLSIRLTADEIETLACAMLDAAHDLRTFPAHEYCSLQVKAPQEVAA